MDSTYMEIAKGIEEKERLLAEKEKEFKAEAYEEIKLSDDK